MKILLVSWLLVFLYLNLYAVWRVLEREPEESAGQGVGGSRYDLHFVVDRVAFRIGQGEMA